MTSRQEEEVCVWGEDACSYRTDLDPFSVNLMMLHLGECYYKLWWSNSVISNECSIKQSSPKANLAQ